jgi:hypothetical protein
MVNRRVAGGLKPKTKMRWIRSHIRVGTRLALVALAIQAVVSFGHIHRDGRALTAAQSLATTRAGGSRVAMLAVPIGRPDKAPDPGCAICALIQLSSTSPPAAAPVLPPLVWLGHVAPQTRQSAFLAASPHFSFQARAPPGV